MNISPGDIVTGVCWRKIRPLIVLDVNGDTAILAPCTTTPGKRRVRKGWCVRTDPSWFTKGFRAKKVGYVNMHSVLLHYKIEDLCHKIGRVRTGYFITLLMIFYFSKASKSRIMKIGRRNGEVRKQG